MAVVVGVILEEAQEWMPTVEKILRLDPIVEYRWAKKLVKLGWILIVVGVAGEGIFEVYVSRADSILNTFDNILLTEARKEASDAVLGAATANIQIAEERRRAAELEKEAAQLRKDAEGLKAENLKLEAIVQPRTIRVENQRKIADACSEFKGHSAVVQSYGLDTEGFATGSQVIAVLQAMKVIVADDRASTVSTGRMEIGIHVRTTDASEIPFASCVAEALKRIGKLETALNDPPPPFRGAMFGGGGQSINGPHITVMVGTKPLPLLTDKQSTKSNK